ncbi:MAG: hypothetical protein LBT86_03715 [Deltaproteobacteria bacterium]|jgi:hypothetical protein|nr:hypothetical protein [Deltaproteobacteria bacterium]
MVKRLIHTTNIVDYHLDTHDGVEMISRYPLFHQLVAAELSEDKAQILAEPVKDLDQNRVNWYTNLTGPVVPFEQLAPDDQRYAIDVIAERAADLMALSRRFLTSNSRNRQLAGELLANILKRSKKYNIYMVGDRPAVVGWGLTSFLRDGESDESEAISNLLRANLGDLDPPSATQAEAQNIFPTEAPIEEAPIEAPIEEPPIEEATEEPPIEEAPIEEPPTVLIDAPKVEQTRERSSFWFWFLLSLLLLLLAIWWLFWNSKPYLWETPDPITEVAPTLGMVIPEGAAETGDFSFLEGCWASSSDSLFNVETELPIIVKYCFDKSGHAKVSLDETDASGNFVQTCFGEASTSFEGNGVVIAENVNRACPDGRTYSKFVMSCKPKSEKDKSVGCSIVQESTEKELRSDFTRLN